jgi:hypothetical protein
MINLFFNMIIVMFGLIIMPILSIMVLYVLVGVIIVAYLIIIMAIDLIGLLIRWVYNMYNSIISRYQHWKYNRLSMTKRDK